MTALSAALVIGSLAVAWARQVPFLTSGDLQRIGRAALEAAVDAAIDVGGLGDAVEDLEGRVALGLQRAGFPEASVQVVRRNDFDPMAAFFVELVSGEVTARVSVEGLTDPLLAIRLGVHRPIAREPADPLEAHGRTSVLEACVARGYYHAAQGAPDLFARLENRTADPYHFGLETFLPGEAPLTLDHQHFRTGTFGLSPEDKRRYGLG